MATQEMVVSGSGRHGAAVATRRLPRKAKSASSSIRDAIDEPLQSNALVMRYGHTAARRIVLTVSFIVAHA
jgi:hypothetical protein